MKKYALISNPKAGRGKAEKIESEMLQLLTKEIGDFTFFRTEHPDHARTLAAEIRNDYEVILAAGGDGTMHEVVNGMMGGMATLGAIPIGSGNDFVKMLNLPKDLAGAVSVIKNDKRKKIDVGKVGDRYFPNGLGIGFDAWVVRESQKVKKLRGFLIYLYSVLKTVFSYQNCKIILTVDGKEETRDIFLIAIGNGKAMGGGFFLTPDAVIDDGMLDVCIIHALRRKEVFLNLPKAIKGVHTGMPQVQMLKTDYLKIVSDTGIAVHADGELLGMELKKLEISILPGALEVIYL